MMAWMLLKQHNMKGLNFITPEGETITVIDFDAANKMAYVHLFSGQHKWYTESEYSQWVSAGTAVLPKEDFQYIPDIPAQMTDEQAASVEEVDKPKRKHKAKKEEE